MPKNGIRGYLWCREVSGEITPGHHSHKEKYQQKDNTIQGDTMFSDKDYTTPKRNRGEEKGYNRKIIPAIPPCTKSKNRAIVPVPVCGICGYHSVMR